MDQDQPKGDDQGGETEENGDDKPDEKSGYPPAQM